MISIGVQMGGPEQKDAPIEKALMKAMNVAQKMRDPTYKDGAEGWVNPIFIVPGSIWNADFEGYKLGKFSQKQKGLLVQIAVPQAVADGQNIQQFIGEALREAVRIAAEYFTLKDISLSTLKAEKIILAIESALEETKAR